jgi:signal transduction histidine kinase
VTIEIGRDGDRGLLAIRDRGPGIPPEDRARVTERFYRGRGAPPGGSGLGLAIARELVERSGGELAVQSQEDQGRGSRCGSGSLRIRPTTRTHDLERTLPLPTLSPDPRTLGT